MHEGERQDEVRLTTLQERGALLEGGECIRYGAKTMPVGGYFSFPKLYGDGFMLVGDSAGTCNGERLKGVHLAIKSGMLCAETLIEAVRKDVRIQDRTAIPI